MGQFRIMGGARVVDIELGDHIFVTLEGEELTSALFLFLDAPEGKGKMELVYN